MRTTWYKRGSWDAICDVCGLKFKNTELRHRWDGLMVCDRDWETRQPQELIRPIPDQQPVAWTRPDVPPTYWFDGNTTPGCSSLTSQGVAGYGTAGCARAGINLGLTS